jgi:hypothetical protein
MSRLRAAAPAPRFERAPRIQRVPNEKPWDGALGAAKPAFRRFRHAQDGINDRSCVAKVRAQLLARGYAEETPLMLDGGPRRVDAHAWLDVYGAPLLAFLASRLR